GIAGFLPAGARGVVVVITDSNVGPRFAPDVERSLRAAGFKVVVATAPAGEDHKTIETVARLYDQILPAGIERSTPVVALAGDVAYLTDLVAHNVAIKARVVEADPFERGERAHLNFGHTFGHAIETLSRYEYMHGECVALGMVAAARMATDLGMFDEAARRRT